MWKNGKPAEEVTEQMAKEQAKPEYIGAWKNEAMAEVEAEISSTDTDTAGGYPRCLVNKVVS